jgi:hypothetical protein
VVAGAVVVAEAAAARNWWDFFKPFAKTSTAGWFKELKTVISYLGYWQSGMEIG